MVERLHAIWKDLVVCDHWASEDCAETIHHMVELLLFSNADCPICGDVEGRKFSD